MVSLCNRRGRSHFSRHDQLAASSCAVYFETCLSHVREHYLLLLGNIGDRRIVQLMRNWINYVCFHYTVRTSNNDVD